MKFFAKVVLSLAIILSIVCPVFNFGVRTDVNAAQITTTATGYTQASDVNYITDKVSGKSVYRNWGARGEVASFLTTKAASYYNSSITYSVLSQKAGGTSQSNAPSSALYSSLQSMMKSKHKYETSYNATRDFYGHTDGVGNVATKLSTFYTGKLVNSTWDGGNTYNREHTWPNSKGLAGNDENDIMMLRPEQPNANSSRGNKAYGQSSSYFDPGESVRGDVARIVLYVYVRWGNTNYMWGTSGVMESVTVLLNWMQEDPVDTWELARNDVVESITGVRNVFVDYPEYAYLLFGKAVPTTMQTPSGLAKNGLAGGDGLPEVPDIGGGSEVTDKEIAALLAKDTLTVAEAKKIGSSMAHDTITDKKFTITGEVVDVSNTQYGNMNITDSTGETIYVYGTWSEDGQTRYDGLADKPVAGDTVTLYTVVGNYNGAQLKNAWIKGSVEGGENPGGGNEGGGNEGGTTTPDYSDETMLALFSFGSNGTAAHVDGNDMGASKTYTEGGYNLVIQNAVKVFAGAYDQMGNSCIKIGTSKLTGSFEFTVPSDVEFVKFRVAQYKANASKIGINGTSYTITTASNAGEYTEITVDTTTNKKVTVETLSGGIRVMIDSISFHAGSSSGGNEGGENPGGGNEGGENPGGGNEGGETPGGGEVTPPAEIETITIAEALEMGGAMAHDTTTNVKYYVEGVIVEVKDTYYGNMTIKDAQGNTILVYGSFSADGVKRFGEMENTPVAGDAIKLLTVVGNYNGAQLKNAWIIEFGSNSGNEGGETPGGGNEGGENPGGGEDVDCKHSFGDWSTVKPATQTEEGQEVRTCAHCGEKEYRDIPVLTPDSSEDSSGDSSEETPCKHSYGSWVVEKPASETEDGLQSRTCNKCGEKESQSIPAWGLNSSEEGSSSSERPKADACNSSLSGSLFTTLGLVFAAFIVAKKSKEN